MPCTNLTSLPSEIIVAIYERLTIREITQMRQTCKLLADIANEPSIWKVQSDHYTESANEDISKLAESIPPSEIQNVVLRRASSECGWRHRAAPVVRNATNDMNILDGGKLLLPGGRWLLTWGGHSELGLPRVPETAHVIFAYDLDGPQIVGPRAVFKSSRFDRTSFQIRFVATQVNYADDGRAGFIVVVASNKLITVSAQIWDSEIFLEIFHFTFDGQASPPIRVIELHSGPIDGLDLRDDFVLLEHGGTYEILNWRTANGSSWDHAFLRIAMFLAGPHGRAVQSRLLPGGRLLRVCNLHPSPPVFQIFFSELEEAFHEKSPGRDRIPVWNLPIGDDSDFVIEPRFTNFSEPLHIQGETRIAMRVQSKIYGFIIPDGVLEKPQCFELARFEQKYLQDIRHRSVSLGIDKLVAAGGYGAVRFLPFTAAFSWPSAEERPSWRATFIVPIVRNLDAYSLTSLGLPRCSIVIDPVLGRVLTGAKYGGGLAHDEDWKRAVAWSVVDFAAPHLLP